MTWADGSIYKGSWLNGIKTQEVETSIDFPIDFKQELVIWIDE
jgi:hypothetical protein